MIDAWQPPLDLGGTAPARCWLDEQCWLEHHLGWLAAHDQASAGPDLIDLLIEQFHWKRSERTMYDRRVNVPRLLSWSELADPETPGPVVRWARAIDAAFGTSMTTVGANYYRDGNDSVAWHGDTVDRRRADSTVAIVSVGAARPFLVRPIGGGASTRWLLGHGDLLVMGGRSQTRFEHSVPKVRRSGPRLSVVLRETSIADEPEFAGSSPYHLEDTAVLDDRRDRPPVV